MKRYGLYTGTLYTDHDYETEQIHECCLAIPDTAELTDYQKEHLGDKCIGCHGCPVSQS